MIDPSALQLALDQTIKTRSLFQVRIRRGLFWHYIEHTEAMPVVKEESERPCPVLFGNHYSGELHLSVTYYKCRINLEIFHALTDGNGAMDFMNILVFNYLKIKHTDLGDNISVGCSSSENELQQDGFRKYYDKISGPSEVSKKAYHIRGLNLPYDQLQFFRIKMPSGPLLKESKNTGVSLTSLLAAKLMFAIYEDMPAMKRNMPVTVSIPVNLRNYYGSDTSRNFFNSINISHVFSSGDTLESVAVKFDKELKSNLKPEVIHRKMNSYQKLEHLIALRMVPLFIKQPVVRFFSGREAKNVTAVISNLGVIKFPDKIRNYISDYTFFCSHSELYMAVCSFNGELYMGITNGRRNTGVLRRFICDFSSSGIPVEAEATEVIR